MLRIRNGPSTSNAWWVAGSAFGTDQEAYFTFTKLSGRPAASEQGLLLKYSGGANPNSNSARWIEVAYDNNNSSDPEAGTICIRTKSVSYLPSTRSLKGWRSPLPIPFSRTATSLARAR